MSEITFKDARYYDLITKEQLSVGHAIMITLKGQKAGVMTTAVEWAKANLQNAFITYGTIDDLVSIADDLREVNQPIAVVLTGTRYNIAEISHWAREQNVTVFLVSDAMDALPRYHVMLSTCMVELTYSPENGQLISGKAIRNQKTMSGWVVDFTEDK